VGREEVNPMTGKKNKEISISKDELKRILAETEEDLDSVMTQKDLSEAGKIHRELSVLSIDDLLSPFTI